MLPLPIAAAALFVVTVVACLAVACVRAAMRAQKASGPIGVARRLSAILLGVVGLLLAISGLLSGVNLLWSDLLDAPGVLIAMLWGGTVMFLLLGLLMIGGAWLLIRRRDLNGSSPA